MPSRRRPDTSSRSPRWAIRASVHYADRWTTQERVALPFDPFGRIPLGRTSLAVTRLGFGGASIGGLFQPVAARDAADVAEHAWSIGIRHFDAAPLYGYGSAERAMGAVLAGRPRDDFVLSTKVGRLVREAG